MTPRKKTAQTAKPPKSVKPAKPGLTRDSIIAAAMAIIDRDGYEELSMRKLGKELGVNPMSIYYHFPNKVALTDALIEVVMSSIDLSLDDPGRATEERLLNAAYIYRNALLAYPTLIPAMAGRAPRTIPGLRPVEVLISIFVESGMTVDDAFTSMSVLASFVRGAVAREVYTELELQNAGQQESFATALAGILSPVEFPNLVKVDARCEYLGSEAMFDRGARALIRGLLETYVSEKEED